MEKNKAREELLTSMNLAGFTYDFQANAYKDSAKANEMYTVYFKFPGDNFYSEEIDVLVEGIGSAAYAEAKRIAKLSIKWGYDPKLVVGEVVHRVKGTLFF